MDAGKLQAYYMDVYAAVRKWAPDCFFVVSPRNWEQDGGEWQNFMAGPTFTKVLQDVHRCDDTADPAMLMNSLLPCRRAKGIKAVKANRTHATDAPKCPICISDNLFVAFGDTSKRDLFLS